MNQLELIKKYNIDVNKLDISCLLGVKPFKYISKEDLEYLYLDLNLSQKEIGILYNISQVKISKYINKNNIKKTQKIINEKS